MSDMQTSLGGVTIGGVTIGGGGRGVVIRAVAGVTA